MQRKRKASKENYARHLLEYRERARRARQQLRRELIAAYGGKCACCGENEEAFLTIEHVNRDGKKHRESINKSNSWGIYLDLKKRGWPREGFELLCFNCNHATWKLGLCPHRRNREQRTTADLVRR